MQAIIAMLPTSPSADNIHLYKEQQQSLSFCSGKLESRKIAVETKNHDSKRTWYSVITAVIARGTSEEIVILDFAKMQ